MGKICSKCLIKKDFSEFHKHNREKDGHFYHCKECRKIKSKNYYLIKKVKNKLIVTNKICFICNIQKDVNQFHKQIGTKDGYRSACKECRAIKFKKEYFLISKKHNERSKKYRINNKDKYNKFFRDRYKKLPHIYAWRTILSSVLRRMGGKKEKTTLEILGYSAKELKNYIEILFTENMSWDNWGEWEIDHIKPVSLFDKNTDIKIVNGLSNLQPLWKEENRKKSNKF